MIREGGRGKGAGGQSPETATGLIDRLLQGLQFDGPVVDVRVGALWTAVAVETQAGLRAGLASTQVEHDLEHGRPVVREAGRLLGRGASELAGWAFEGTATERTIGFAALNALLQPDEAQLTNLNAGELITERGAGRRVAIVGHFPFVPQVQAAASACWVLELRPGQGDLPADQAPTIIPQADVVGITGMSLVNGTFDSLARLCRPDAFVIVLGATTPLSPVLYDYGVAAISGTLLADVPAALAAISQGANFRQIPGKRLVTMMREA